jgi:hypothetical protein
VVAPVSIPRHLLGLGGGVGTRATSPARSGLLLLLGAGALAVLAVASGSLMRLLGRMDEVQPR